MLCVLEIIVGLVVLVALVLCAFISQQGDAKMLLDVKKRTSAVKLKATDECLYFDVEVPFKNIGKQEATIFDVYMRIYLPQEQYGDVLLRGKVNLKHVLREDDYFESMLIPAGTGPALLLRFEAYAKNGKSLADAIAGLPDVDVALYAEYRGRKDLLTVKEYLTLSAEEMHKLI